MGLHPSAAGPVETLPVRQCGANDVHEVVALSVEHALAGGAGGGQHGEPQLTLSQTTSPRGPVQLACPVWLNLPVMHPSHCTATVLKLWLDYTAHTRERRQCVVEGADAA